MTQNEQETKASETEIVKSLRSYDANLYMYITDEFEKSHIHPYDIQLNVVEQSAGVELIIRYGDAFQHESRQLLSLSSINNMDEDFVQYIKEVANTCKETMIADYYKMMSI